ncbi:MAG: gliding motility-associated C-terminal domain-containing protein [Saprospiraceae bacterium]|nr:gliding motility-associated C-terminal domain-containing protein [Saprospiraceae bacterium]
MYSWTPTTWLDDPTHPNPIASPLESIAYTATISDSAGVCTIMKTIFIQIVDSDVLLNFDESKECDSYEVMFINQSRGATSFIWTFGDPTNPGFSSAEENPTYTYPGGGTYDVQLKSNDDPNCTAYRAKRITLTGEDFVDFIDTIQTCDPRSIPLNPDRNPNYIYAWKADPAISDTTAANPIVSLTEDRTFMVTVTDPLNDSCTIMGTVVVLADDRLVRNLPDSIIVCIAGPVQLNPQGNPDFIYLWEPASLLDDPTSFNPTATITETTVFSVYIEDPQDETCSVDTEVKVVLADYIKLITSDSVTMACPGDTAMITAKVDLLDSWTWFDPAGNVISVTDTTITVVLTTGGFYRIEGKIGLCDYVDSIFMGVRTLQFDINKDLPVCANEPVDITVTNNTDFKIDSIIWTPMDDIVLGQGSEKVTVRPTVTSTYTATVYFEDGCIVTDSVTVQVSDMDRFVVTADPDTIFFGESSTLTATLEAGATYSWSPSDVLQTPNSNTTVAIPDVTTTFTVTITDASGCTITKTVTVVVIVVQCEPPFVFMPNAFSPNSDNENDILYVRGKYIEEMDLFIYNRWGEKVFESHDPAQGWDGRFRDKLLAPDVYGYYLRILCIGGDSHTEKGNVTILH